MTSGSDQGRVGAHIINKLGRSGTFNGDEGLE